MTTAIPALAGLLLLAVNGVAQGFHELDPIRYSQAADDNAITALNRRLAAGEAALPATGAQGRLRPLLQALGVPESSQMLVFTRTSLHRTRISPRNPRALYFGPDVYVGWVPGAPVLEIAAGDPKLGLVFYTLPQAPEVAPVLRRDDSCLSCHGTARTDHEPGLLLRSVFPDDDGEPIAAAGETDVALDVPLAERWGGWLVTGTFAGTHRGNGIAHQDTDGRWHVTSRHAGDLRAFASWFEADAYLAGTSDIGALLAFEQQATIHNLLIRANLQMQHLLERDRAMNAMLGESGVREQTARIADVLAHRITTALLLREEASLDQRAAAPLAAFAHAFAQAWPVDAAGRRLGQLDLGQRLFTMPLSPMVHAPAFAALPAQLRDRIVARLRATLGKVRRGSLQLRQQRSWLHEHLQATLPGY